VAALWVGKNIHKQVHAEAKGGIDDILRVVVLVVCPAVSGVRFVSVEKHHSSVAVHGKSLGRFSVVFVYFRRTAFGEIMHNGINGMIGGQLQGGSDITTSGRTKQSGVPRSVVVSGH